MADVLNVEVRESTGKRNNRRLRRAGCIPAILYGHGKDCVSLTVSADQMEAAIRHGSRLVELQGGVSESALVRELQWDCYGQEVLHIDFTRVSADERIEVALLVELRGQAPGTKAGGVVEQLVREIAVECLASAIPGRLTMRINALELDAALTVADFEPIEGVKLLIADDKVIVQCVTPTEVPDEKDIVAGGAEPEVIGRKDEEDGEGDQ